MPWVGCGWRCSGPKVLCCAQVEEKGKSEEAPQSRVQACIFKVGDDCRPDGLALQVVRAPSKAC